jgi:hypothetical protein
MRMSFLLFVLSCQCGAASAAAAGETQRSEDLLQALAERIRARNVAPQHVGVVYDVNRGERVPQPLFKQRAYHWDAFQGAVNVRVSDVKSLESLHEAHASHVGLDFLRGMFVRAPLPFYTPTDANETHGSACFLSIRSDELIAAELDGSQRELTAEVAAALAALPSKFSNASAAQFRNFFEDVGTHWTEKAVFGGKLSVSSVTEQKEGLTATDIKRALDIGIRNVFEVKTGTEWDKTVSKVIRYTSDRISAEGGDNRLIPGTRSDLTPARYQSWVDSVRVSPAIVRYKVRSVADLITGDVAKRQAMKEAIQWHLGDVYHRWAEEQKEKDAGFGALLEARLVTAGA